MMMLPSLTVAAIFWLIICLSLALGKAPLPGVLEHSSASTLSLPSSTPWLRKVRNHGIPRGPGCWGRPWICGQADHGPGGRRMRCCRNQCVDVSSDVNNCGLCGIRCPFSWQCCRGFCVDTNNSPWHCGGCGNRCPWGVLCAYGMCGYAQPQPPWPRPPFPFPPLPPLPPFPFPPRPPSPWPPLPPHPRPPLPPHPIPPSPWPPLPPPHHGHHPPPATSLSS